MQKFTYLLLVLVLVTLAFSLSRRKDSFVEAYAGGQKDVRAERYELAKRQFPTADYDEPDLGDPEKQPARKEKQKRYNNFKVVHTKPQPWQAEILVTSDSLFDFPALPVAQSDLILTGVVGSAEAHLSENKKNVFSEFTVAVDTVLKGTHQGLLQGSVLTVDRIGGFVKYPNGQKILFRFAGANMPKTGARYLFFINSKNRQDYNILTAYELSASGILPLDLSSQFLMLEGISETEILQKVRNLLSETRSN